MASEKFDPKLVGPNNPFGIVREEEPAKVSLTNPIGYVDPITVAGEALLVQELNASLDKAVAIVKTMRPCRENSMVITKIDEAQMWLEKGVK